MFTVCLPLIYELSEEEESCLTYSYISASEIVPGKSLNNYLFNEWMNEWASDLHIKKTNFHR